MLKRYCVNGSWFWFEEGEQPEGAVCVDDQKKEQKAANKARKTKTKKTEKED